MTTYEYLMNSSDECCRKAIEFYKNGDVPMSIFFKNASEGFKIKALELTIDEGLKTKVLEPTIDEKWGE